MHKFGVDILSLRQNYTGYQNIEVYLASDADAAIAEAVKRERDNCVQELLADGREDAARVIRKARVESKPEPRLGTNPPTATATTPKIEYCRECGTALGIVEAKPCQPACQYCAEVKIERLHTEHKVGGRVVEIEFANKLNELIDAWNGGKA
jgi:hypothetical protein